MHASIYLPFTIIFRPCAASACTPPSLLTASARAPPSLVTASARAPPSLLTAALSFDLRILTTMYYVVFARYACVGVSGAGGCCQDVSVAN